MNITTEAGFYFYLEGKDKTFFLDLEDSEGLRDCKKLQAEVHWVGQNYQKISKVKSKFTLTHVEGYLWKLDFSKPLKIGSIVIGVKEKK
jgi:hypothetical protein